MGSDDIEAAARALVERIAFEERVTLFSKEVSNAAHNLRAALALPRESPGCDIPECRLSTTYAEAVREKCAQVCDARARGYRRGVGAANAARLCANAIRALPLAAAKGGARG